MSNKHKLPFEKGNFVIMLVGIGLLMLGFFIMTLDQQTYGFGMLGITIGPIIVFIGFMVEFFAIFYKPKNSKDSK